MDFLFVSMPALFFTIYILIVVILHRYELHCTASSDLNAPTTTIVEVTIFVVMGAGFLLVWEQLVAELSSVALTLLILGIACYVIGIGFFVLGEYKPIYHTVWHMFVVLAATLHWFDVYFFVVHVDLNLPDSPTKIRVTELVDTMNAAATATAHMMNATANSVMHNLVNN